MMLNSLGLIPLDLNICGDLTTVIRYANFERRHNLPSSVSVDEICRIDNANNFSPISDRELTYRRGVLRVTIDMRLERKFLHLTAVASSRAL
jgi:hypothetical protein